MTDNQPTTCTCAIPSATAHVCYEVPKVTYLSNDDVTRLFVSQHPAEIVAHRDTLAAQIQRLSDFLDARSLNSWKHGACWAAEDAIKTLTDRVEQAERERDEARAALDRVKALADEWATEGPSLASHAYSPRDAWEGSALEQCATSLRAAIEGP